MNQKNNNKIKNHYSLLNKLLFTNTLIIKKKVLLY